MPTAFDGPSHSHLTMSEEVYSIRGRGGWGKGETGGQPMPVPFPDPSGGCGWVSSVGPAAEFCPRELIEPAVDGLAHASAVRVRPPPDCGVELADHLALGQGLRAWDAPSQFRQRLLEVGLGGCAQGLEPQAMAVGGCPRGMCASPVWPDVKPSKLTPRLGAVHGVAEVTVGLMQRQSHACQPRLSQGLTVRKDRAVLLEYHAVIGIGDAPSAWGDGGDGLVHTMQSEQRSHWGKCTALRGPCGGRGARAVCAAPCWEPGCAWPTDAGG